MNVNLQMNVLSVVLHNHFLRVVKTKLLLTGQLTVQIITSLKWLINYLMILQSISNAFGIHYKHLGFDNADTLRDAITIEAAYSTPERIVQDARSRLNKPTLKPEGPEGTPSFATGTK